MKRTATLVAVAAASAMLLAACQGVQGKSGASIVERKETITTFPFSDPSPVPILARSGRRGEGARLYPYFSFNGFSAAGQEQEWTVVRLENPYLQVAVLPEVGGKVWGATEKSGGEEFLYTNHVLKFREIALRGPWTSGGIEFNFGLVGHAPSTATPVDYVTRRNGDGSVSCVVGAMDLPSRTRWSVTVTLHPDAAAFETNARWHNPTPFSQSYYAWSCAAIKTADDLKYIFPGTSSIGHDYNVPLEPWPVDRRGRDLSWYRANAFPGSKSYFTVGELEDFYGAWYETSNTGFGHWARPDDMPGRKVWIWDLSRQGEIWVELLTETDGQYTEPQAGRLYNQSDHEGFPPGRTDSWQEQWFAYSGIGPMVKASPWAVLSAQRTGEKLRLGLFALRPLQEDLVVSVAGQEVLRERLTLRPADKSMKDLVLPSSGDYQVRLGTKIVYDSDPAARELERPLSFAPPDETTTEGLFLSASRAEKERRAAAALEKYLAVIAREPRHVRALARAAELYTRRGENEKALAFAGRALENSMYDAEANYVYGVAARRQDRLADAKETFGWAARSLEYRPAAYTGLAEIALWENDPDRAVRYADLALAADQDNLNAREVRAVAYRKGGAPRQAREAIDELLGFDPLDHLGRFELHLLNPTEATLADFKGLIRCELPHETYLEMALFYFRLGLADDALTLLRHAPEHPEVRAWQAFLLKDRAPDESRKLLDEALALSPFLVFPFREESIPVFSWAIEERPAEWKLKYYLGLIYWGKGRAEEATGLFDACDEADFAPFFLARGALRRETAPGRAAADFERAVELDPETWRGWHALIDFERSQENPGRALQAARQAAVALPGQVTIRVDLVKTLLDASLFAEAASLLDEVEALPSEGARELHGLFVRAHLSLALEAMKKKDWRTALGHLERSKDYPERLGTGAPFHPDVRLQDYLAAVCHEGLGEPSEADGLRQSIADYTLTYWDEPQPHGYFGALVLHGLGQKEKARELRKRYAAPPAEILSVIRK